MLLLIIIVFALQLDVKMVAVKRACRILGFLSPKKGAWPWHTKVPVCAGLVYELQLLLWGPDCSITTSEKEKLNTEFWMTMLHTLQGAINTVCLSTFSYCVVSVANAVSSGSGAQTRRYFPNLCSIILLLSKMIILPAYQPLTVLVILEEHY